MTRSDREQNARDAVVRAAVRRVVDSVPPYIGLTGDALESYIWKGIRAKERACARLAAIQKERKPK